MTEKINLDKSCSIEEAIREAWAKYRQRISEVEATEGINGNGFLHVDETALAHLHKATTGLLNLNSRQREGET